MSARKWLNQRDPELSILAPFMRAALLAVLDECDRWDVDWFITNWPIAGHMSPPTAPIRAAIDKALGVEP